MEQRRGHPLDIDLLGLAVGGSDAGLATEVADHLGACLLCRVRLARIRRSGAVPSAPPTGIDLPLVSPEVLAVLDDAARPDVVAAGQVWLAGSSRRLLVWVRAVRSDRVVAHPVTLDVEAVDDTALIVDDFPPLGSPVAVVTSIVGTVPVGRFVSYVGDLDVGDDVERLRAAATAGTAELDLPTGRPIVGLTDERLEFRQLLADDLADLDTIDGDDEADDLVPDGADTPEVAARRMYEVLRSDVLARRGPGCAVRRPTGDLALGSFADATGCVLVAVVTELTSAVLLITGDDRLGWAREHPLDASKLLRLAGATTLAVAEPVDPFTTCLFEERHLHPALELPRAVVSVGPRPGWGPKPMVKALFDYLEDGVFAVEPVGALALPSSARDLLPYLRANARQSVNGLRQARAQLTKNTALKSLKKADADALARALDRAADLDDLLASIERITER
jgi:hypothetical protein